MAILPDPRVDFIRHLGLNEISLDGWTITLENEEPDGTHRVVMRARRILYEPDGSIKLDLDWGLVATEPVQVTIDTRVVPVRP
jgi:hypothetical protein